MIAALVCNKVLQRLLLNPSKFLSSMKQKSLTGRERACVCLYAYAQFCPQEQPIPLSEYLPLLPSSSMRGSCRSFSYSQTWTALVPTLLSFYYSLLALNDAQRQAARENCSWEFLPLLLASWLLQNSLLNIFFQLCSVSCILSQNAAVLWHFLCCQHGRQHLLHGAIAC